MHTISELTALTLLILGVNFFADVFAGFFVGLFYDEGIHKIFDKFANTKSNE